MKHNLKNKKTRLMVIGIWSVLIVLFSIEFFIYTWSRIQCVKTGYEIAKESNKNLKLLTLQNNLKIEIARLKSPRRIAKIATKQIGLIIPTSEQIIIIP
ncbi:MAG: cell division protein FtsL [Desulfobacterium sp.]|nr:cell division protein FtsL [Desulfobacterium sp.]MBU3949263.1 cell division protein FtsL [Pseudomonadota bacterium]MBU4010625.1 cell division protein FtsL [Pseudomonadota bacterium]MBU4035994.1 cell division protein FtsL [Pseudomonadota bacterium]